MIVRSQATEQRERRRPYNIPIVIVACLYSASMFLYAKHIGKCRKRMGLNVMYRSKRNYKAGNA